ncbi:SLC13 family permease [Arthrobacter sp. SD76]|uniref:SLC13 family permease n=1 Tax=Arthrobacter sp. SD76 TaxID=3415007 RepID=UPI003C77DFCC
MLFGGISLIRRGNDSLGADAVAWFARGKGRSGDQDSSLAAPVGAPMPEGTTGRSAPTATLEKALTPPRFQIEARQVLTLLGICLLIVLGVGFKLDIGLTAFTIGLALSLMSPKDDVKVVAAMAWSTILMIGGIMTYIGVVQKVGGMELVSNALSNMGSPTVGILMVAFLAAFTSLFSATGAVSGALVPLIASLVGPNPDYPSHRGGVHFGDLLKRRGQQPLLGPWGTANRQQSLGPPARGIP